MFTTPHRQKGSGPQLGAPCEGERGPFGEFGAGDDSQDDQPDDFDEAS